MVRSPAHPHPFAGLDAKRVAGNSLVIVLHAVVFGALMMPSAWSPPERAARETVVVPIPIDEPPPVVTPTTAPPQPVPVEVRPRQVDVRTPTQTIAPVATDPAPAVDDAELPPMPPGDSGPVAQGFDPPGPALMPRAYDLAPAPRYPRPALRDQLEGTVMLKVLVDVDGRPLQVEVETSSGHRVLDQAARDQVLARWRFHPAQRDGRVIQAWALVPIAFNLP